MGTQKPKIDELEQFDFVDDENFDQYIDGYPELIGEFMISFSALEHYLNHAVADYLADDFHDRGYRIVEKLSFSNKVDYLCNGYLGREVMCFDDKADTKTVGKIKSDLSAINKFRNMIAHANWLTIDKDGFVRTKIFTDGTDGLVKFSKTKITKGHINNMINRADDLPDVICEYDEEFWNRSR